MNDAPEEIEAGRVDAGRNSEGRAMVIVRNVAVAILLMSAMSAKSKAPTPHRRPNVVSCSQATLTRPQVGVAYKGKVAIEDYKFDARIPNELIGWGGVASSAPFHGFTVFLGSNMQSCIVFEVHVRVDDNDAPLRPASASTLALGQAEAWQTTRSARVGARQLSNVRISFVFDQGGQIDDGEILLVSPSEDLEEVMPVYEEFVKSIRFGW